MMPRQLAVILLVLLAIGCGGTFRRPQEEKTTHPVFPNSLPYPLELAVDTTNVPAHYPLIYPADTISWSDWSRSRAAQPPSDESGVSDSYRIQIYMSKLYSPAAKELNVARELFNQKVWFDYDVPYYKIRVGDFSTREEAEKYLPVVKEAGYESAWVIRVTSNIRTLEDPGRSMPRPAGDSAASLKPEMEPANDSAKYPGH